MARERRLIRSEEQVRLLLAGATIVRVPLNPQPLDEFGPCPLGQPGDHLWIAEAWRHTTDQNSKCLIQYRADGQCREALAEDGDWAGVGEVRESVSDGPPWRSAATMPRWASRLACPLGQPGDHLWIAEAFYERYDGLDGVDFDGYAADGAKAVGVGVATTAEAVRPGARAKLSAARMSRTRSRLTCRVLEVGAQRVQDVAVGVLWIEGCPRCCGPQDHAIIEQQARNWHRGFWDRHYAAKGYPWANNPWTWWGRLESKGG